MTMSLYSGTPGSGKSLSAAKDIEFWLKKKKKNVIANIRINSDFILKGKPGGRFYYLDNCYITPDFLYQYALRFHDLGVEGQTLIVIDEAQIRFSPTACKLFAQEENSHYRQDWLEFFTQHRHLGYDILMISPFDRLIDAQIRTCFEYNYIHRKANNFKTIGQLFTIFGIKLFTQIQFWYGANVKCSSKLFVYQKRFSKIYNSYAQRNYIVAKLTQKFGEEFVTELTNFSEHRRLMSKAKLQHKVI